MKKLFTILALAFVIAPFANAQQKYGEIALSDLEELSTVVRSEDRSVMVILSEVPELQFESTRQIFEVRPMSETEWHLFLEPGRQIITVRASGYLPVKTDVINLQVKRAYRIKVSQVKPVPGTLVIKTIPEGANLRINGAPIDAQTPYSIEEAPPGSYYVQISKPGFRPAERTLTVESNQTAEWQVELIKSAVPVHIEIENDLQDVGILVDGEAMGVAPGTIYLEPGSHHLALQKPGYESLERVIEITLEKEEVAISEKLSKKSKSLLGRWWFLTSAAAITGGTVFLLSSGSTAEKPLPEPPDFPGGN